MKDIAHFVAPIQGFNEKSAPYQIEVFGWFLHEVKGLEYFNPAELRQCYEAAHLPIPPNVSASLAKIVEKRPVRVIRNTKGYKLSSAVRAEMEKALPVRATTVKTTALLSDLLTKVTEPAQKTFLLETLNCFKNHAYRAAVVMAWNLAFSDVIDRIVANHLPAFNTGVGTHGLKKPITRREDFEDFSVKESVIITIGRATGVLGKATVKILEEKLDKRNTAAHPSNIVVSAATAEEVIFDLVQNILLRPAL